MSEVVHRQLPSRRAFVVGAAMTVASAAAYAAMPRRTEDRLAEHQLEKVIPEQIGQWRFATNGGVIVPREAAPPEAYDQVLARSYEAPGQFPMMLLIAYGSTQGGSLQVHRPETCYPGEGFSLSTVKPIDFGFGAPGLVHGRTFSARRDERIEQVLYWTRIADTFPQSTAQEYLAIMGRVLSGVVPDGVLVRISTVAPVNVALSLMERFAHQMVDSIGRQARILLVGQAMTDAIAAAGHSRT